MREVRSCRHIIAAVEIREGIMVEWDGGVFCMVFVVFDFLQPITILLQDRTDVCALCKTQMSRVTGDCDIFSRESSTHHPKKYS